MLQVKEEQKFSANEITFCILRLLIRYDTS